MVANSGAGIPEGVRISSVYMQCLLLLSSLCTILYAHDFPLPYRNINVKSGDMEA